MHEISVDVECSIRLENFNFGHKSFSTFASAFVGMEFVDVPAAAEPAKKPVFDEAMIDTLRDVFEEFDKDESGTISTEEMFSMVVDMDLGLSNEEIAKLIKETDEDGSGEIEFEEFVQALRRHMSGHSASGLGSIFSKKATAEFGAAFSDMFTGFFTKVTHTPVQTERDAVVSERKSTQRTEPEQQPVASSKPSKPDWREKQSHEGGGGWQLSEYWSRPRVKAATPTRSECLESMKYYGSPPKTMREGVPMSKFRSPFEAKHFFAAPRVASTAAHSMSSMRAGGRPSIGGSPAVAARRPSRDS